MRASKMSLETFDKKVKVKRSFIQRYNHASELRIIKKHLSKGQKEIIRLLQKKEALIVDKKDVFITRGKAAKKVTPYALYKLVNNGLIFQNESPFDYVLSNTGKIIKV